MEQALEQPRLVPIDQPGFLEAWEMVASQLRMEMKRADYETWVAALRPLSFNEGVFRIGAVNAYARDWVESRLRMKISRLLESVFNQPVSVHFTLMKGEEGTQARAQQRNGSRRVETGAVVGASVSSQESPASETAGAQTAAAASAVSEAVGDAEAVPAVLPGEKSAANGRKKKSIPGGSLAAASRVEEGGSPRKIQLQRAYGTERARVIQPERGMFLTMYFFHNWLPLLGHSAMTTVIAARSLCYWNPMTGELRNVVETDMSELAKRAAVSVRTVKDVLNNELVKRYFLRYKVRRIMTPNGVRTAGILLQVRMDDPMTPEDQDSHHLAEEERWYTVDFEDKEEE